MFRCCRLFLFAAPNLQGRSADWHQNCHMYDGDRKFWNWIRILGLSQEYGGAKKIKTWARIQATSPLHCRNIRSETRFVEWTRRCVVNSDLSCACVLNLMNLMVGAYINEEKNRTWVFCLCRPTPCVSRRPINPDKCLCWQAWETMCCAWAVGFQINHWKLWFVTRSLSQALGEADNRVNTQFTQARHIPGHLLESDVDNLQSIKLASRQSLPAFSIVSYSIPSMCCNLYHPCNRRHQLQLT